jgi:hypothetical protein
MTRSRGTAAAGLAVLAACVAASAPAQQRGHPTLTIGAKVDGALVAGDPTANERGRFRAYDLPARKGQRLSIAMHSTDFDSYLSVGRTVQGITDYLKHDDDGGGSNDARIRFTVPETGTYVVVAQALSGDGTGAFTVSLDTLPTPVMAPPVGLQPGRVVSGTLTETDPTVESDDSHYDLYTFNARAGQRLQVSMKTSDMDAYVSWGRLNASGEFEASESDDDGGGGTDARLRVTAPADGQYLIRANTAVGGQTGAYTLVVEERAPLPPPPPPAAITVGQQVNGSLSEKDAQSDEDTYYDLYRFAGHKGDRLTITMRADSFDTFVALGRLDGNRFTELETADDGADGTNSKLEFTLDQDGDYVVRATSLFGNTTGSYTLLVESTR